MKITGAYFWLFEFLLKSLRRFGILGELIFTVYGLVWLLWPLYLAYRLGQTEYWIGAAVLTIILIVRGRQVIIRN